MSDLCEHGKITTFENADASRSLIATNAIVATGLRLDTRRRLRICNPTLRRSRETRIMRRRRTLGRPFGAGNGRLSLYLTLIEVQRVRRGSSHLPPKSRDRWSTARMNSIRNEDDDSVRSRIHPQTRAGKSRVPEAADGERLASRPREGRIDIPAEAPCRDARRRLPVSRKDGRARLRRGRLLRLLH